MAYIIGIDLGTSSVKAMLFEEEKGVAAVAAKSYQVEIPKEGYAEQEPEMWWAAVREVLRTLRIQYPQEYRAVRSIGLSGQMHGLVLLDMQGKPLRPAILWLDQRSGDLAEEVERELGTERMGAVFHNKVFSGFAFPSLLWVQRQEPEIFETVHTVLCPKDYIRFRLTGELGTDVSDASASSMFDTGKRRWAYEILNKYGIPEGIFPQVHESQEIAGTISRSASRETGLSERVTVVYGCGDQPAQSIGNGAVREGILISNIGTGGQISTYSCEDHYDQKLRVHTFCHGINRAYTIFGAALCSGMSMNWLKERILRESEFAVLSEEADRAEPGSRGVIYLPYLSGERTPHMNPHAKGMFFGLKLHHDRGDLIRAVMEGVVYSLRDSLEIFQEMGLDGDEVIASGGGAKSSAWLQIQADVLGKRIRVSDVKEQACLGACIVAGIGSGIYRDAREAAERFVKQKEQYYEPRKAYHAMYQEQYEIYKKLYQNNLEFMK